MQSPQISCIAISTARRHLQRMRILFCITVLFGFLASPALALTNQELESIGKKVWQNECGGTVSGLTSWNEGEDFPSLGIGHFIWYPKGKNGPFEESFPKLVVFLKSQGVSTPSWLSGSSPWNSRSEFKAEINSSRMTELRKLLASTIIEQSRFLAQRMNQSLPKILAAAPAGDREHIQTQFQKLAASGKGTYALIDYVNFKGEGTNPKERYKGDGWGLMQVLQEMKTGANPVKEFGAAAARVLTRRVKNAPRDESQWLKGWTNRVGNYE